MKARGRIDRVDDPKRVKGRASVQSDARDDEGESPWAREARAHWWSDTPTSVLVERELTEIDRKLLAKLEERYASNGEKHGFELTREGLRWWVEINGRRFNSDWQYYREGRFWPSDWHQKDIWGVDWDDTRVTMYSDFRVWDDLLNDDGKRTLNYDVGDVPPSRPDDASPEGMREDFKKQDLNALAADLGYTFEEAAATLTAGKKPARAAAVPRPKWEKDAMPDEDPAHFAARAGYEHRGLIHAEDPALSVKLANWLRTHQWPADVPYIPTKPEWIERQIEAAKEEGRPLRATRSAEGRLHEAARYRAAKF